MNAYVGTAGPLPAPVAETVVDHHPSALVALYLALTIPEAATIRVTATGARPSTWRGVALDSAGERLYLPFENNWAHRIVRANPEADWSETLDFALPTGALSPSGLASRQSNSLAA